MHNFRDLKIWQEAINLATKIYQITTQFPSEEKYGLTSQLRRCAVSIPSSIAEGAGRNSNKMFVQFLGVSFGSANELITQTIISKELNYITEETQNEITEVDKIQKMNFRLQERLNQNLG